MSNSTDLIHVAAWASHNVPETITLTRFKLPTMAHETLAQWTQEGSRREGPVTVMKLGLPEVLAWFVPEVAFVRHDYIREEGGQRLCLFFLGDHTEDEELRRRVQFGLSRWLTLLYPQKPAESRAAIAGTAVTSTNWMALDVATGLKQTAGACPVPQQDLMWDALSAYAVKSLAGKRIHFQSGESKVLIPQTPQAATFNGLELVAFPPKIDPSTQKLWAEVITVSTATFPEQPGVNILAKASVRNWGPVTGWGGDIRTLDVFYGSHDDFTVRHHTSFGVKAIKDEQALERRVIGVWDIKKDERIFDLVRSFIGAEKRTGSELLSPVTNDGGLWMLPRLGSNHGDLNLPGGTGMPWGDRKDIANSLDKLFAEAGFSRNGQMARVKKQMPVEKPFKKGGDESDIATRRAATVSALEALGNSEGHLDFHVFHLNDNTPQLVEKYVTEFFGEPSSRADGVLRWDDGLAISIITSASDVLGQALPWVTLTEEEKRGRTETQWREIERYRRKEANEDIRRSMAAHIAAARTGRNSVACAILEMPASLKDNKWKDPYALARQELAKANCLPQVVLVAETQPDDKYLAAVRDCIRMLGVVPTDHEDLPVSPAAISVIQRNAEIVGGGKRTAHAFPLAARVRNGILECALANDVGEAEWMPYAKAALCIFASDYSKFGRNRQDDNIQKFNTFFSSVIESIDRHGPAIVLAEGGHKFTTLDNKNLSFDRLMAGNRSFTPRDLPNIRLIRISPDDKKLPQYYFDGDAKQASGFFSWQEAERTFYGVKSPPKTMKGVEKFAWATSRHQAEGSNLVGLEKKLRQIPQMDEICVAFMQETDKALELALLTHRLRGVHAQFDDETRKPFPLHELSLLGDAVTF